MSVTTAAKSTGFSGDAESSEAALRPSSGLEPEAIALETNHLSRTLVERVLVSDVNVQVRPGEVLAVVGPSGAGKSSFLRLLNRLDEPTGGTVYVGGSGYHDIPPRILRRRLGMVMQTAFLFPGTVAENIRFGPRQHGEMLDDEAIP